MEIEVCTALSREKEASWQRLLAEAGLTPDGAAEETVLLWEGERLAATGSRDGSLLKFLAVGNEFRGQDLMSRVVTTLRQRAFSAGCDRLFLYTKPGNEFTFRSLFFYPVAKTRDALLMEDRRDGVASFLSSMPRPQTGGTVGACVMNCDPFTLGHRYLVETAAGLCDQLYLFVLSEDKGFFSAEDRMEMVRLGTADLKKVTVLPTGPYLISSATFPTYFLKDRDKAASVQCELDVAVFLKHFVPYFSITRRFVGTEPLSAMTNEYNKTLKSTLPPAGVEVFEIPRLESDGAPVSASLVRRLLQEKNTSALSRLVPKTTYDHITRRITK